MIMPRTAAPALSFPTLSGGVWTLADRAPQNFTFVTFYRGSHCPLCAKYLKSVEAALPAFAEKGVDVVAVSMDSEERAQRSARDWGIEALTIGYGLTLDQAAAWGLYFSSARAEKEPAAFSEPGHFLIRPNNEVFFASTQSAPFTRPSVDDLLSAVTFVTENGYPARGVLSVEDARALVG